MRFVLPLPSREWGAHAAGDPAWGLGSSSPAGVGEKPRLGWSAEEQEEVYLPGSLMFLFFTGQISLSGAQLMLLSSRFHLSGFSGC